MQSLRGGGGGATRKNHLEITPIVHKALDYVNFPQRHGKKHVTLSDYLIMCECIHV